MVPINRWDSVPAQIMRRLPAILETYQPIKNFMTQILEDLPKPKHSKHCPSAAATGALGLQDAQVEEAGVPWHLLQHGGSSGGGHFSADACRHGAVCTRARAWKATVPQPGDPSRGYVQKVDTCCIYTELWQGRTSGNSPRPQD